MTTRERLGDLQYGINMSRRNSKRKLLNNKQYKRDVISMKVKNYFASK